MLSFLYGPTLTSIHDDWKNHSLDYTDLCIGMSLLFNMLSRLVITSFLPRSKCLLISWLQSPSAVMAVTKVYFNHPGGSDGKASAYNVGELTFFN